MELNFYRIYISARIYICFLVYKGIVMYFLPIVNRTKANKSERTWFPCAHMYTDINMEINCDANNYLTSLLLLFFFCRFS